MDLNKQFPLLQNDLILRVINGHKPEIPPIWIMRQAGRYLPEFQELRKKYDFFTMVRTPEIASEITLQPIRRYKMDAAIIFSDILILCQALGMTVEMVPGKGPVFPDPLESPDDVKKLNFSFDPSVEFKYLMQSVNLTRHKLDGNCPLIGFAGAPWTLMAYMTNSGSSKTYNSSRKWLYLYPKETHDLLMNISNAIVELLLCQLEAGAQILMIFESQAEVLNLSLFSKFCLPYLRIIGNKLKTKAPNVPIIIFAKGAHYAIESLLDTAYDVVGLDWSIQITPSLLTVARAKNKVLMGNLDPATLYGSHETIESETTLMLEKFKKVGHIVNLGHGIYPDIDPDNLKKFIDTVRRCE